MVDHVAEYRLASRVAVDATATGVFSDQNNNQGGLFNIFNASAHQQDGPDPSKTMMENLYPGRTQDFHVATFDTSALKKDPKITAVGIGAEQQQAAGLRTQVGEAVGALKEAHREARSQLFAAVKDAGGKHGIDQDRIDATFAGGESSNASTIGGVVFDVLTGPAGPAASLVAGAATIGKEIKKLSPDEQKFLVQEALQSLQHQRTMQMTVMGRFSMSQGEDNKDPAKQPQWQNMSPEHALELLHQPVENTPEMQRLMDQTADLDVLDVSHADYLKRRFDNMTGQKVAEVVASGNTNAVVQMARGDEIKATAVLAGVDISRADNTADLLIKSPTFASSTILASSHVLAMTDALTSIMGKMSTTLSTDRDLGLSGGPAPAYNMTPAQQLALG